MSLRTILLVVEDDSTLRELYRLALGLAGYTVHAYGDAVQALPYLEEHKPDLIVLDLNMPRQRGNSASDDVYAHAEATDAPTVLISGVYSPPKLSGATILRKPVSAEHLTRVVTRILEQQRREWIFASESQTVQLVRLEAPDEPIQLLICGPGSATQIYREPDSKSAAKRQQAIEDRLIQEGYRLMASERRSGGDRRSLRRLTPDRRRFADALL